MPVEIVLPEPEQKEVPLETKSDVTPAPLSQDKIQELSNKVTAPLVITDKSEVMIQDDLLDISFLTDRNSTAEIELKQYNHKGQQIDINSAVKPQNQENEAPATLNHHNLFKIDNKASTFTYAIRVTDEAGDSSSSELKTIDVKDIVKNFKKDKKDSHKFYFIDPAINNIPSQDVINVSESVSGSVGTLSLGQYDTMSSALDITSYNLVSTDNALAYYSAVNGNITAVSGWNSITPDNDWYKVNVTKPVSLALSMTPNANANYSLYLYNAAGNNLAFTTGSLKGDIRFTQGYISSPGYYYIKVIPRVYCVAYPYYDSNGNYCVDYYYYTDSGAYSLTAYNNIPVANINPGSSASATINSATDVGWYRFSVSQKSKANLKLQNIPSGCDYDL